MPIPCAHVSIRFIEQIAAHISCWTLFGVDAHKQSSKCAVWLHDDNSIREAKVE